MSATNWESVFSTKSRDLPDTVGCSQDMPAIKDGASTYVVVVTFILIISRLERNLRIKYQPETDDTLQTDCVQFRNMKWYST